MRDKSLPPLLGYAGSSGSPVSHFRDPVTGRSIVTFELNPDPEAITKAMKALGCKSARANPPKDAEMNAKDCLASLADEIEIRPGKPRNTVIRLLRHMAKHPRATFEELREHVHEGYPAAESTIEGNIREAQAEIKQAALPVKLSTKGFSVVRADMIE
jgi:hypothetical protein